MQKEKENAQLSMNGELRQLKDQLIYQKTLSRAFVNYMCELARGGEISVQEINEIESTFLESSFNLERNLKILV